MNATRSCGGVVRGEGSVEGAFDGKRFRPALLFSSSFLSCRCGTSFTPLDLAGEGNWELREAEEQDPHPLRDPEEDDGTGRMRYLRHVPRRCKSNFREGTQATPRKKAVAEA
ncbi:hypothetical protein B296_00003374 [Ensete ventricosum]|uniref:Uncharacterized protein n=1 Tax=Ensete ventricosum TaxID=4639 RepID=A0A427BC28_ENSVE|nr:hypothetical protein B296_00003374 [Ensete ventricosum]